MAWQDRWQRLTRGWPKTVPDTLPQIALAELQRRVFKANEAVAARQRTNAQLQPTLRTWAAIAAWFHADVRALIVPEPGVYRAAHAEPVEAPCWIDFCPPNEPADKALLRLANETRRAYEVALTRAGGQGETGDPQRALNLARLDQSLSIAAGLPAFQPKPAHPEPVERPAPKSQQVAA